jgi:cytochrome c
MLHLPSRKRMARHAALLTLGCMLHAGAHAAGEIPAGKSIFAARCASCHSIGSSARSGFGPQLNGVIGRPAGGANDYKYSPAMKNSGIVWSEKNLRAFLKAPGDVVPGTKMRFWGMGNAQQIDDLLAYLRTFQ